MTDSDSRPTPRGLNTAGRRLWAASTTDAFDWAQHDLAVLEEACRTRDRIVQLDAAVASDGLMITSSQGNRLHPAVVEARQQRHTLAQLLKTLDIPELPEDVLPAARSVRGVRAARAVR